jgi:hypothetical protein
LGVSRAKILPIPPRVTGNVPECLTYPTAGDRLNERVQLRLGRRGTGVMPRECYGMLQSVTSEGSSQRETPDHRCQQKKRPRGAPLIVCFGSC